MVFPRLTGLPPVVGPDPVALILGSFPSVMSLEKGEYYANPRNRFWHLMEALLGIQATLPYHVRTVELKKRGIALWDITKECEREGSDDTAIRNEILNDIPGFLRDHPSVSVVILNGGTAGRLFHRHFPEGFLGIMVLALPSTSPANARISLSGLVEIWGVLRDYPRK
ncbi:MAG: DNA-deoxyinosine glycosylase [Methanomicrobiales archaeon]|nr:DNA-deoxyinosine glycosylase [Methanomicrobiales archaeon]